MEKLIRSYETIFVVDPDMGDEAVKESVEKFTALIAENGEIAAINEWGRRRLAYPINYKNDGYYVLVSFKSESSFPTELDRVYNITDGIIRSIIVCLDE